MSFREKSAWISVLSMAGIYGFYFWSVMHAGPKAGGFRFGGLLETIIALVFVQVVLTVAVAIFSPEGSEGAARRARQADRAAGHALRLCRAGDGHRAAPAFSAHSIPRSCSARMPCCSFW